MDSRLSDLPVVTRMAPPLALVATPPHQGLEVVFDDVWCGGAPMLKAISFTLEAGSTLALVGRPGAGKWECSAVLTRERSLAGGRVLIGGVDLRDLPGASLPRLVAMVRRSEDLAPGSIADNIARNFPQAGLADVRRAARRAGIDQLIEALPAGYDTPCEGSTPGLRRALAVARAFLQDAPILILEDARDEDPPALAQALVELRQGRTVLMITHRPETMAAADWIVVLEDGRLVEEGRHAQLLAWNDRYARLIAQAPCSPHRG